MKVQCPQCLREFTPDGARKTYCDPECYRNALRAKSAATFVSRFWAQVNKQGPLYGGTPCWLWTGNTVRGYGQTTPPSEGDGKQRKVYAHRLTYEWTHGPTVLDICHHCDTPACVNPNHLFAGTANENLADGRRKGRVLRSPAAYRFRKTGETGVKLTEFQVAAVRAEIAQGLPQVQIAQRFGITKGYVSLIKKGARKAHVSDPLSAAFERVAHHVNLPIRGEVA